MRSFSCSTFLNILLVDLLKKYLLDFLFIFMHKFIYNFFNLSYSFSSFLLYFFSEITLNDTKFEILLNVVRAN
jgi:hypothetical protein